MNLPNKLTLSRIALTPVVLLFMVPLSFMPAAFNAFILTWPGRLVALFLFSAASLTDLYDGRIARAKNIVSTFGKFLDPIADKLLIISVLIAFAELNRLSSFVPVIVLFRELAITGIRLLAAEKGVVIAASRAGKWKTVTQMIAIIALLLNNFPFVYVGFSFDYWASWLACLITLYSGIDYFVKNKALLKSR